MFVISFNICLFIYFSVKYAIQSNDCDVFVNKQSIYLSNYLSIIYLSFSHYQSLIVNFAKYAQNCYFSRVWVVFITLYCKYLLTRKDLSPTCQHVSLRALEQRKKILSPHEESKLKNFKKIRTSDSALSTEMRPLKNVAQENASKLEREREHA